MRFWKAGSLILPIAWMLAEDRDETSGSETGRFITHSSSQSSSICDVHPSSYRVLPIGPDAVYTCGGVHYPGER